MLECLSLSLTRILHVVYLLMTGFCHISVTFFLSYILASSRRLRSLWPRTHLSSPDLLRQLRRWDEQQRVTDRRELRRRRCGLPRQHPEDREEEPNDSPEERRQNLFETARCHRCRRREEPSPAGTSLNDLLRTRTLKGHNGRARVRQVVVGSRRLKPEVNSFLQKKSILGNKKKQPDFNTVPSFKYILYWYITICILL